MHRLIALAGTVCVVLLISTGAFAQVSPNPDNPNDAIPDVSAPPSYGEPINLETAKKVAAAAITETTKRNWNAFCVSVVNPSGDLVYFEKQDNCQYASIGISQHKARTAARYRRPTLVFETLIGKGPYFAFLTTLDDVIASRGVRRYPAGGTSPSLNFALLLLPSGGGRRCHANPLFQPRPVRQSAGHCRHDPRP